MAVPASFKVHIFTRHDPVIATLFLRDLYADFPHGKWNLAPMVPDTAQSSVLSDPPQLPKELWHRKRMGRFILHTVQLAEMSLGGLLSVFAAVYGFELKHLAQFTIFPQSARARRDNAPWYDRSLPSTMSLTEAWKLDNDMWYQRPPEPSPPLHLVLETKAAALGRTVGDDIDVSEATAYELRDAWSTYESFWRDYQYCQQDTLSGVLARFEEIRLRLSELSSSETALTFSDELQLGERLAKRKQDLCHAREVLMTIGSNHLEYEIEHEIYILNKEIEQLEPNLSALKELKSMMALHVYPWEQWVMKANYNAALEPPNLQEEQIEDEAKRALQQIKDKAANWTP
ncbi:hypothetical protein M501DRAFT_1020096 [Patellaria atrata CBS 101060]|uniref:Uncharacterized protein n=1 Tax=Patellaria atrata CBS 101060 TaxID=1346257 RepID=A0A9P4S2Y1_9PEZI|nr:hypothetical protein M501DRAFT_1020096 [Patellaria atrata CBS 101060]